ncbi:MAG: hypothetical protein EBZ61_10120 [Micrococcales bacterium]|nr:hypothetical protein [Micrococcales bacterium]
MKPIRSHSILVTNQFRNSADDRADITRLGISLILTTLFLALLGVHPVSSLTVTLVLAAITWFGHVILSWAGFENLPLAVALLLGMGMLVFVSQFLLVMNLPAWGAHWGTVAIMTLGAIRLSRSSDVCALRLTAKQAEELEMGLLVAAIVLSARQPWIIPFASAVGLVVYGSHLMRINRWTLLMSISVVAGALWFSQSLRVENWWYYYQGNDAQFFEAISWSTSKWGIFEDPGFVGGSIASYHWLTYAFLGSLSHLAALAPWIALMKIGPLLLALGFASIFINVASQRLDSPRTMRLSIAAICVIVMPTTRVDSFSFSILIAMAFVLTAVQTPVGRNRRKTAAVLSLLAMTLLFGKISTAAVVVVVLATEWTITRIRGKDASPLPLVALSVCVLTFVTYLFLTKDGSSQVATFQPSFSASLNELQQLLGSSNISVQFCLWLFLTIFSRRHTQFDSNSINLALLLCTPVLIVGWIFQAQSTSIYFGTPAIYLLTLMFVGRIELTAGWGHSKRHQFGTLLIIITAFFIGFNNKRILEIANSRWGVAGLIGDYVWSIFEQSGHIYVIAIVVVAVGCIFRRRDWLLAASFVTAALAATAGFNMNVFRETDSNNYLNWPANSAPFANDDLRSVGLWIRKNTTPEVVLASNNFCCAGDDWWQAIALEPAEHLREASGETKWGGANYLLPAETRRRFLAQGLRFQTWQGMPTLDQIARMSVSLQFANSPSPEVVERLRLYGVSGYVVNLALTEHRDWSPFAVELARTGDFVYLELR